MRRSFTRQENQIQELSAFTPAIAQWELTQCTFRELSAGLTASTWPCFAAILFVDISGFTHLCTLLSVDRLQRHINAYFTMLINVVIKNGGRARPLTSNLSPPTSAPRTTINPCSAHLTRLRCGFCCPVTYCALPEMPSCVPGHFVSRARMRIGSSLPPPLVLRPSSLSPPAGSTPSPSRTRSCRSTAGLEQVACIIFALAAPIVGNL